jgi:hypothetical protein
VLHQLLWVEDEVTAGFEEERKRGEEVLFPIRLDGAVMNTNEAWASKLRARFIGDFRRWKDHEAYQRSFERVVRDLSSLDRAATDAHGLRRLPFCRPQARPRSRRRHCAARRHEKSIGSRPY